MHVYMDNNNDALYSNSDDSLSSDTSFNTGSNNASHVNEPANKLIPEQSIKVNKCSVNEVSETKHNEEVEINKEDSEAFLNPVPSTSSHYNGQAQYPNNCSQRELVLGDSASCTKSALVGDLFSRIDKEINSQLLPIVSSKEQILCHLPSQGRSSISPSVICFPSLDDKKEKFVANPAAFSCKERNDFNDDAWGDSEGGSDDEVCTCLIYSNETGNYMDKELPSRDVDLSGFIESVSMSDNLLLSGNALAGSSLQRKRKLRETQVNDFHRSYLTSPLTARKRIALENASCSSACNSPADLPIVNERKLPSRLVIPTKENPPPELESWIAQFQRWSHVERLLAVDKLIEHCEPTQVRHMMKVIEPQFQRDFISLLPKELALQVLSYLEPKDLLRAAQTCRSWRFLCDDNLLWKEKCKQAHILPGPNSDKPKRGRAGNMPAISSTWKAAFIRQHIIETNWRSRPIREPKVLKGHDDHVITCLQFQGSRIVSGSDDNTLKVWSAISGKCLRTLVGHTGGVWSSQMSENVIVSGSTDRTLKVWNIDTGQCIHTLQGHTSTVRCMHLHGKKVVSGSRDATLRVWDVEKGICLHLLEGHQAAVRCVQYDGKFVVSGAYDYMVRVWIPEREECLHTLKGHTNRVYSLQFDGIHIVSGSLDTTIRVWDAETGSCKHTLKGHQSLTSGMELRDNILVSGNADSTVKVWDITTGQCLQTLSGPNKHQSAVTCLQFNSRFVITSSDDGTVKLWDVKSGEFIRNLVSLESGGSGGVVWRIRTSDTKLVCAVGSRNGTEETKLMVLDFDVDGACAKCS